ncbi:nicotinamide riboside kinase 1 [Hermetia illucens]|nr:nicotinamide riboside kinase 1 [Hermetia illucens]
MQRVRCDTYLQSRNILHRPTSCVSVDKMVQWLVIGISGVTCGGKTSLATGLHSFFTTNQNKHILNTNLVVGDTFVLNQDNYFLPEDDMRHKLIPKLNHINWEVMTALDMEKMLSDIRDILKPGFILYDKNRILPTTFQEQHQQQINILILEGFLIFNHPQLLQLCQVKFHLHLPYEKCFQRRQNREYNPPDVTGYFEMCVWPMYERHFREIRDCEEIIMLNGELSRERLLNFALRCIGRFL